MPSLSEPCLCKHCIFRVAWAQMKKHHVAPSHALIWATGVTNVTRNVAHLQPSITSSLESLIHWLSSGCQIWSWGDLWQNVSRKHEWQLEWTALNEQGWNRCLQQQNATNTFIYLAGSCVYMQIYYIYTYMQIKENPSEWSSNNRPNMLASTRRTKFCSPPLCRSFLKYPAMPDLLKTILKQKKLPTSSNTRMWPFPRICLWLVAQVVVVVVCFQHFAFPLSLMMWPQWVAMWQADGVCQVFLRQVIRILVCWCFMDSWVCHGRRIIGGKSMGDQVWSSHHWEQGCTN